MSPYLYKANQTANEGINRNEDGENIVQDGGYQVIVQKKGHFSDNRTEQGSLHKRKGKKSPFSLSSDSLGTGYLIRGTFLKAFFS